MPLKLNVFEVHLTDQLMSVKCNLLGTISATISPLSLSLYQVYPMMRSVYTVHYLDDCRVIISNWSIDVPLMDHWNKTIRTLPQASTSSKQIIL